VSAADWSPDPALADALQLLLRRRPVLLAFDFDGVLAPIVDEPSAARALDGTADLLAALAEGDGVHVALVSGRALADLRAVAAVPADSPLLLVGSHGAEFSSDGAGLRVWTTPPPPGWLRCAAPSTPWQPASTGCTSRPSPQASCCTPGGPTEPMPRRRRPLRSRRRTCRVAM
jgi:hypothetical protein